MFGKVNLNSCCVPIFQSLALTVAEINSGSQFFSDAPLAQPPPPPILVLNVVFRKINGKKTWKFKHMLTAITHLKQQKW